jgi:hypothetical protein
MGVLPGNLPTRSKSRSNPETRKMVVGGKPEAPDIPSTVRWPSLMAFSTTAAFHLTPGE